ncbi:MAG: hypothetical protein IJ735_07285 [Clostridia bacterium]|nr:hypothetical protein [Clostridia bacterium]
MLRRIKDKCLSKKSIVKEAWNNDKAIIILVFVAAMVGFLLAIAGTKSACENSSGGNLITKIALEDFSAFVFLLKILLFAAIGYAISIFTCVNRVLFFISIALPILTTKIFLQSIFVSCAMDGWSAYILLIVFYLPVLFVHIALYSLYLSALYRNTCAGTNWKCRLPFGCTVKIALPICKKFLILSIIFHLVYSAIIIILLSIII